jgi:hypothetical protein
MSRITRRRDAMKAIKVMFFREKLRDARHSRLAPDYFRMLRKRRIGTLVGFNQHRTEGEKV